MKFIAYSDPHVHPHHSHSKVLPDGMNSRLVDTTNAVNEIYRAATEKHMPVIFGGDLFQVKNSMHVLAFNEMSKILRQRSRYTDPKRPDIMCIGNHDMATSDGTRHALEPFLSLPNIAIPNGDQNHYVVYPVENIFFAVIPYPMEYGRFSHEKFVKRLDQAITAKKKLPIPPTTSILVSHFFTHELMKKHLDLDTGDVSGKELLKFFDLVLLGHHHIHDVITGKKHESGRIPKVISIGSPLQLRSDERGEDKGYLIIDTETLEFERVLLPSPKFHSFESLKSIVPEKIANDFVSVKVTSKAEYTKAERTLTEAGVASYRIELLPKKVESRIDLSTGAKDDTILTKFLGSEWGKTKLDQSKLKEIGLQYLG